MILRWRVGLVLTGAVAESRARETLDEAWALALQQDHSLAAARNQAEAAGFDAQAARAQRWPTVAVGGSYTQLDDSPAFDFAFTGLPITPPELFEDDEFVMGSATLTVPLFTSGRISSSIAAAEARERGVGAQVTAATADVKLAVADAYVGVLRARKALGSREQQRADARGAGPRYDQHVRARAGAEERIAGRAGGAGRRAAERAARGECAEVAPAAYNRRLGEPLDRPVELSESLPVPVDLSQDLPALVEQALSRRTELDALDAQAEAYGQLARTERSRVLPQLALTGGYNYLENQFLDDETVGMAGIGVQWALFDGGQSRKRAAALDRNRRATEQQRADASSRSSCRCGRPGSTSRNRASG